VSNEVEKTAKGLKGLLKGRKGKNAAPEQEAEQSERVPEKTKAKAKASAAAAAPESTADQFIVKPPEDGNLIKLWELWANYAHRPEPSFACGGREAELFESERNLIMESRLIMARIEQDAQRQLGFLAKEAAQYRWERMKLIKERGKFLAHPLEKKVYEQFLPYIKSHKK